MALKNPAMTAIAATNPELVQKTAKTAMILGIVTIAAVAGFGYYQIYYKHRFRKMSFDKNAPNSNVTPDVARVKADTIYKAMYGARIGFSEVKQTLSGVNRNGFIAIYNAFGKRKPADVLFATNSNKLDLIAWFNDQFSVSQRQELRFLVSANGLF